MLHTLQVQIHPTAVIDPTVVFRGSGRITVGAFSRIDAFTVLTAGPAGGVHIRRCVHIGAHCSLLGSSAAIVLHDFSGMSPGCRVFTGSDRFKGGTLLGPCVAEELRNVREAPVTFRECTALGAGCTVLPGVEMAFGSLAAAHSVLQRTVREGNIVAGVPAMCTGLRDIAAVRVNMAQQQLKLKQAGYE